MKPCANCGKLTTMGINILSGEKTYICSKKCFDEYDVNKVNK